MPNDGVSCTAAEALKQQRRMHRVLDWKEERPLSEQQAAANHKFLRGRPVPVVPVADSTVAHRAAISVHHVILTMPEMTKEAFEQLMEAKELAGYQSEKDRGTLQSTTLDMIRVGDDKLAD